MRLQHAFEGLLAEPPPASTSHARAKDIRDACSAAIAALRDARDTHAHVLATFDPEARSAWERAANTSLWLPFELCLHGSVGVRYKVLALDAVQKLVVHGELVCEDVVLKGVPGMAAFDGSGIIILPPTDPSSEASSDTVVLRVRKSSADVIRSIRDAISTQVNDELYLQAIKALHALVTSPHAQVHGKCLVDAIDLCMEIALASDGGSSTKTLPQATARASVSQVVNYAMVQLEASLRTSPSPGGLYDGSDATYSYLLRPMVELHSLHQLLQRDTLLILERFVRFATIDDDERDADKLITRVYLALDCILGMLAKAGEHAIADPVIVRFFRDEVCNVVLKSCLSTSDQVLEVAVQLFMSILEKFTRPLRTQLETVFDEAFFHAFEDPLLLPKRKMILLNGLHRLCSDTKLLITVYDVFQDYGTSLIFGQIVSIISRIAQQRSSVKKPSTTVGGLIGSHAAGLLLDSAADLDAVHSARIRIRALRSLGAIVKGLADISRREAAAFPPVAAAIVVKEFSNVILPTEDELNNKRHLRNHLEIGLRMFNDLDDAIEGIRYWIDHGVVEDDCFQIASMLAEAEGINKASLGKFLAAQPDTMLRAYMRTFALSGDRLSEACVKLIISLTLPADLGQFDRFIKAFAERYCDCNEDDFASADTVYDLLFFVMKLCIRLQRNEPVSKDAFTRECRTINFCSDLSDEYLALVYDDVAQPGGLLEALVRSAVIGVNGKPEPNESIRSMFVDAWTAFLGTFSRAFEEVSGDEDAQTADLTTNELIQLCLSSMQHSIWLAGRYQFVTERAAFVTSMAKFTGINHIGEIKQKNILAIRSLLLIADDAGEYLSDSWITVIDVLSQFHRLATSGSHMDLRAAATRRARNGSISSLHVPNGSGGAGARKSSASSVLHANELMDAVVSQRSNFIGSLVDASIVSGTSGSSKVAMSLKLISAEMTSDAMTKSLDRLMLKSASLSGDSVIVFLQSLAAVSLTEFESSEGVSFCLGKIVEATNYNLQRTTFEWTQIWQTLQPYFEAVGSKDDDNIAMFAVSALLQLQNMYLEHKELPRYRDHFELLLPLDSILKNSRLLTVHLTVLQSLRQIIAKRSANLKSGWLVVFAALGHSAKMNPKIMVAAFELLRDLITNSIDLLEGIVFSEAIRATLEFLMMHDPALVEQAIGLLQTCAMYLSEHETELYDAGREASANYKFYHWFPIFSGLSRAILNSQSEDLQFATVNCLSGIIKEHGSSFNSKFWHSLYSSVLAPLLQEIETETLTSLNASSRLWMAVFDIMVDAYAVDIQGSEDGVLLLSIVTDQILRALYWQNEAVCQHAIVAFMSIIDRYLEVFDDTRWTVVSDQLEQYFTAVSPTELDIPSREVVDEATGNSARHFSSEATSSLDFPTAVAKCTLQLFMVQQLDEKLRLQPEFVLTLPEVLRKRWMRSLYESFRFAQKFNEDKDLRQHIWKAGFVKQLPNLFRQQMVALTAYMRFAFILYGFYGDANVKLAQRLIDEIGLLFEMYVQLLAEPGKNQREIINWSPCVIVVWQCILDLPWEAAGTDDKHADISEFLRHIPGLYQLAVQMIASDRADVRGAVSKFLRRTGERFLVIE